MCSFAGKSLLIFGDSIMYGSGNDGYGVGEFLKKECGFTLEKYCVGGARTGWQEGKSWIVEQVKEAIQDGVKPDYIVFDGFTNDCNMTDGKNCDVPLGEITDDITDIFDIKREGTTFTQCFQSILYAVTTYFPTAKALFIRPHKMGRRDGVMQVVYGERAKALCEEQGIAVADIYEDGGLDTFDADDRDKYTADTYGWGRGDCTHPNARGYVEKYLPVILKRLNELK